ncbi:MAG: dipicolinate synthase subunit B [Peptococcaceae bacterium]|nr:dipicolinate synthase subunit B [Peptococcaceae bacterium]
MRLKGVKVGLALTGSFCTLNQVIKEVDRLLAEGADIYPIVSPNVATVDTRFGMAQHWKETLEAKTGHKVISTIVDAEPIGPKKLVDVIVIAPCTGNTLAKLANGITDNAVLMAAKAQLRNQRPVVVAISTNDGLGINARNLGTLLNTKNIYLVPFGQDNPQSKPNSLIAKMDMMVDTILYAIKGIQIQPVLVPFN